MKLAPLAAFLLAFSGTASAATLDIVETVDVPFNIGFSGTPAIAMQGVNRVTGTLNGFDADDFLVQVLPGDFVSNVSIALTGIELGPDTSDFFGIGISAALRNRDFSNSDGTTNIEALTASPGASLSVATSLPSDLYVFGIGGFYRFNPGAPGQNVVINYVAEFTVAAIPLPATAWLMLAGLGGLAAAARRRGLTSQGAHP